VKLATAGSDEKRHESDEESEARAHRRSLARPPARRELSSARAFSIKVLRARNISLE
jgi:hypothetical protein